MPRSSPEISQLQSRFTSFNLAFRNPTSRLLFRKMGKALDDRINQLAATELKVQKLTAALERAYPKKRRKVVADPNEKLVRLRHIREVKWEMEHGQRVPRAVTTRNQVEEVPI